MALATPEICLDCGASLSGAHCSACGQRVESPIQPLAAFLRDAVSEFLSLNGRLFTGLRDVALKPGFLTAEFLAGHRTRHLHPVRLLLAAGLVAFLASLLMPEDADGFLVAATRAVLGDAPNVASVIAAVAMLFVATTSQRFVYRKSGRVFVEHVVLLLHTTSFAMLLTPLEVVALHLFPSDRPVAGTSSFVVAPLVAVYWILALRDVFGDRLETTILKAGLTVVLATGVGLALLFTAYGISTVS